VTRLWHAQEDLRKSVDRLTKVDSARQLLLKNMTTVVEKERKRFVSELHDDALQKLTAAELHVGRLSGGTTLDAESLETLHGLLEQTEIDRKSTRLNSSHQIISYAVFCLK